MVQKDPGGVEAQIPEPPRCRCAVTPAATALAAGHVPSMARSHPDASRPPASHLKGDTDGRSLQLFYLKEKKKKIPTHTRNKTSHEKEFRVALLALCAPWSSLPSPRLGPQRCARPPDSRLDCGQSRVTSSPLHAHRLPVLLRLRAPGLSPGSLCLGRRGAPLRRELCRPLRGGGPGLRVLLSSRPALVYGPCPAGRACLPTQPWLQDSRGLTVCLRVLRVS